MSQRTFLGNDNSISERVRVYRTPDAVELDQIDQYQIFRKRVFFDEVRLVTLHAKRGAGTGWVLLILGLLLGLLSLPMRSEPVLARTFQGTAAGFVLVGIAVLLMPVWVVTVFGKRSRARVAYRLGEKKAREVYGEICRAAAEAQRALARGAAVQGDFPAPPPLPLSASEPPPAPLSPA
jgi:hypothetical protein